jgi:hypothetical protein
MIKNCYLLIPRPPYRTSKLQEKPSALKRENPALQNMKFLFVGHFCPPGSGSTYLMQPGSITLHTLVRFFVLFVNLAARQQQLHPCRQRQVPRWSNLQLSTILLLQFRRALLRCPEPPTPVSYDRHPPRPLYSDMANILTL